jgi:hypothetical protein
MAAFFAACNTGATTEPAVEEVKAMTVDELQTNFANLVDSMVIVKGEVDHVCKHGGTKMVIFNPETETSIHIDAGASGNFRADEVANQTVIVWGKVEEMRVDEAYIENLQAELDEIIAKGDVDADAAKEMDKAKEPEHKGEAAPESDNKHKQEIEQRMEQIKSLKEKLATLKAEGKDHISYYSVNCDKYEVVKDAEGEAAPEAKADSTESK